MDKRFNIDGAVIHTFKLAPLPPLYPIETIPEEVKIKEDIGEIVNFATIFCNQSRHTTGRRSLYPPSYNHHISFWENMHKKDDEVTPSLVSDSEVARLVMTSLPGLVANWVWLDTYHRDGRVSRTAEVTYTSLDFALGPRTAYNLHYNVLGKSLENVFGVELR